MAPMLRMSKVHTVIAAAKVGGSSLGCSAVLLLTCASAFTARSVIITAGTFLRGKIHLGTDTQIAAGRAGDQPSLDMAQDIENLGLRIGRFKTGTPPRIDGRSVDW